MSLKRTSLHDKNRAKVLRDMSLTRTSLHNKNRMKEFPRDVLDKTTEIAQEFDMKCLKSLYNESLNKNEFTQEKSRREGIFRGIFLMRTNLHKENRAEEFHAEYPE